MREETAHQEVCQSEEIAAYLDGELSSLALAIFEDHLQECSACAANMEEQKRLLCTLDFALGGGDKNLRLPENFAQTVAVRAENDMSGVRKVSEHALALRACAVLALVAFALLGGAAISDSVFRPALSLFRHMASLLDIAARVLYDAGAGLTVISRDLGGHLLFESHPLALFGTLLLLLALGLILRHIGNRQSA